jgi:hypothetical protein
MFITVLTAFFNSCISLSTDIKPPKSNISKWYDKYKENLEYTEETSDVVNTRPMFDDYTKNLLKTNTKCISYKEFCLLLSGIENRCVDNMMIGVKYKTYQKNTEMNPVIHFFEEKFEITNNPKHECSVAKMFKEYAIWKCSVGKTDGLNAKEEFEAFVVSAMKVKTAKGRKPPGYYGKTQGITSFIGVLPRKVEQINNDDGGNLM